MILCEALARLIDGASWEKLDVVDKVIWEASVRLDPWERFTLRGDVPNLHRKRRL